MFKNYFLIAFRNITRNKAISFINIFGLAVSMSICLLLIIIVADQMHYDDFHAKKDRIYRINTERTQQKEHLWSTATTASQLADVVSQHTSVEKTVSIDRDFAEVAKWKKQEMAFSGLYANNAFFQTFNFPLAQGNPDNALTLPNSIVLTKKLASSLFGDTDPLDQIITIEGKGEFLVTGVMAEFPGKTHFSFEALASINYLKTLNESDTTALQANNDWHQIYTNYIYVLLKEGSNPEALKPLLDKAALENYDQEGEFTYEFFLQPLTGITPGPLLSNNMGFGLPIMVVYVMLGIALVVLCSACFNYANLTTAKAVNRAKEIGVRKVVGAKRWHIFMQFMLEAVIIATLAFVFADLMAQWLLPMLNNYFASMGAPMSFDPTPNLYIWFIAFVLLAGLLAGLVPALFFSATNPLAALKKAMKLNAIGRSARVDIRKVLVVIQFAFTIFFVITIITIYQQTRFVITTDHGFKTEGIVNVKLQGMHYEPLKAAFENLSGVTNVASTTHLPALGTNNTANVRLTEEEDGTFLSFTGVDNNYLETMDLELLAGKNFPEQMPDDEKYIIVNERLVAAFDWEGPHEAVGKTLIVDDNEVEIIGVVKDFHYERLDEQIGSMALRYQPKNANNAVITINQSQAKEAIAAIKGVWKQHTTRPFSYSYYEDDLRMSYGHFEALLMVLGYVTIITVSISCLGLLGMVMYHVQNKTKEIGIRKTLGAEAYDVLKTVGKSFLLLITIAYLIGGPLAYFVNNMWLTTNAYRIDFGLPTLLLGFVSVLCIVALTVGAQLYKALRINPAESLRSE
ncbi:FtsX-like permease family protein [Fulvivirga sp. RKSG066]|uniref:ABC transporter permease n=1 Tax=Fulvivirga aurantia TaxID=2529383 RepID=UPI0012BD35C9|nr:ABC transporter permease [Fulvivirga aurantia]MTI21869.1 FtsX-like permease family protein [Fulvivirga aurantia]